MYISYNKNQVYGKIALIIIISFIVGLFIFYHPPFPKDISWQFILLLLIWVIVLFALIFMALQLLIFPKGVEIDDDTESLTIHYFLKSQNTLYANDILNYTTTKIVTRSTNYEGVLVHSKTGQKYLFDDFNITDFKPIKIFLDSCKISFVGHEKFTNISYFISYFKIK